ncbi:LacI family DNA-binding transcriptional regulator [Azospirillum sp. TSO35-2]|uniref:LacI family DNA-binding transcriptional regulator n=1 Tax=Azospirillum sp. TSO35-2 TaxID=716796 RepID=UPI0018EE8188|nr:LacI family DNA-binding transcriptional regulator [Azospirillum sp. TSO35-2]
MTTRDGDRASSLTAKTRKPRSSRTGRATMADVAERVGISAITVSRAFKRPELVAPELRQRILDTAQSMGYVPNQAASALASARSMTVAVLIPSMTNMVFVETMAGIHDQLLPRGYQVLIGVSHYSPLEEERLIRTYLQFQPDGILLTGTDHTAVTQTYLSALRSPTVHMMELLDDPDSLSVGCSQEEGGRLMTTHLLERGYRRIGFVAVQLDPRTMARFDGYRNALTEAGLYDEKRVWRLPDPSSIHLGAAMIDRMMAENTDCDAVFFCNDDLAQGALFQCQRRGIRVPDQLAIGGFNDLPASAWTTPTLTTVATPRYGIGRHAAAMLLDLMEGREPAQRRLDLGLTFIAREST